MSIVAKKLLDWYRLQSYPFPWREDYSGYKIWISEIMLQQSQVNVVIPYYNRWMKKLPSMDHLSKTNLDELLLLWQGLGYYSRALNLHFTAKKIVKDYKGKFPNNYHQLSNH